MLDWICISSHQKIEFDRRSIYTDRERKRDKANSSPTELLPSTASRPSPSAVDSSVLFSVLSPYLPQLNTPKRAPTETWTRSIGFNASIVVNTHRLCLSSSPPHLPLQNRRSSPSLSPISELKLAAVALSSSRPRTARSRSLRLRYRSEARRHSAAAGSISGPSQAIISSSTGSTTAVPHLPPFLQLHLSAFISTVTTHCPICLLPTRPTSSPPSPSASAYRLLTSSSSGPSQAII
ncbi:hypothetical protein PIB30_013153 [Stylosanthes scabra]|uniref:Uncharacterized protein n=1 Tax=Stylosanthes scabra TaxID=79078 RepID=A0ABU6Y4H6_9FABA|nr:hypothetical protein [Stylosanthes scabra]